ncbi:unnamed protein product, partial [Ilex paraguariensis]
MDKTTQIHVDDNGRQGGTGGLRDVEAKLSSADDARGRQGGARDDTRGLDDEDGALEGLNFARERERER